MYRIRRRGLRPHRPQPLNLFREQLDSRAQLGILVLRPSWDVRSRLRLRQQLLLERQQPLVRGTHLEIESALGGYGAEGLFLVDTEVEDGVRWGCMEGYIWKAEEEGTYGCSWAVVSA